MPERTPSRELTWLTPEPGVTDGAQLAAAVSLPELAVRLLVQRGMTTPEAIGTFLSPRLSDLHDPLLLPDIEPALARIARAIRLDERILVFGDYDVDGTTGTALLVRTFRQLGNEAGCYTPHRGREGYGLSELGIRQAKENGYSLVVAVDCGTTDFEEIALAKDLGLDVVVCDHHEPQDRLPDAVAVVNPKRTGSRYPFPELCGCGVAFKLAQALCQNLGRPAETVHEHLDLVALATIADIVPLSGENRILAKIGLGQLRRTNKAGLRALLEVTGLTGKELGAYDVGFVLGPRINASGRVAEGAQSVQLLLTEDRDEALGLARELDAANRQRRAIEDATVEQAIEQIAQRGIDSRNVIVLADERWHEGVIGIVASRIADRFFRPAILIALGPEKGKGSGRSIPGFHLYDALASCTSELLSFGGHKYAAGLVIERGRVAEFDQAINAFASGHMTEDILTRKLAVSAIASLAETDRALLEVLRQFEPFGPENPRPVFACRGLEVVGYPRKVGKDHLRFTVRENKTHVLPAIAFGRSEDILKLQVGKDNHLDIAFQFDEHCYGGKSSLQLVIKDMKIRAD